MTGLSITQTDLISKPYTVRQSEATSPSILLRQIWHLLPKAIRAAQKEDPRQRDRQTASIITQTTDRADQQVSQKYPVT